MKIIINASNVHYGGQLQVAISFITELIQFSAHEYHVFLSVEVDQQIKKDRFPNNFSFYTFSSYSGYSDRFMQKWMSLKRLRRLKLLERVIHPDVVFSVFGPVFWRPVAPHVAGFALPTFVYHDSPYFKTVSGYEKIKRRLMNEVRSRFFLRFVDFLVVETEEVRQRLIHRLNVNPEKIFQVSNTYSRIFNHPETWSDRVKLPARVPGEIRMVTISANHLYKNLKVIDEVISQIRLRRPLLRFKFILTINRRNLKNLTTANRNYVHFTRKIKVEECPYLYSQCDFMFLPSLLDCFSASYPEAMKMGLPVVTSDLSFAKNVCGDAAMYFDPLNPADIAEKIIQLSEDKLLQARLVARGREKLKNFGTASDRAADYLQIAQKVAQMRYANGRGLRQEINLPALT